MPSTLAPDRFGASSRRVLSRETRSSGSGEVTLSKLIVGLLEPARSVGDQWSHTGLCRLSASHNSYIRSFVLHLFNFTGYSSLVTRNSVQILGFTDY